MSRLSTFSFLYHYLPRPLSALDCAKHGWKDTKNVVEKDDHICVLTCSSCQNEMFVIDVDLDKADPLKGTRQTFVLCSFHFTNYFNF